MKDILRQPMSRRDFIKFIGSTSVALGLAACGANVAAAPAPPTRFGVLPTPGATLIPPTPTQTATAIATGAPTHSKKEIIARSLKTVSLVIPKTNKENKPSAFAIKEAPLPLSELAGTEWKVVNGKIVLLTKNLNDQFMQPDEVATYDDKTQSINISLAFAQFFRNTIDQKNDDPFIANLKEFIEGNSQYAKVFALPYDRIDIQPAGIMINVEDKTRLVPIPANTLSQPTTVAWDEQGKRFVVTSNGKVSSYIDTAGNKDITPTIQNMKILGDEADKQRIAQALKDVYPIVTDGLLELVDNFDNKPGAPEFRAAFVKNHPEVVDLDKVLAAVKKRVTELQEGVYGISAIGTYEGFDNDPTAYKFSGLYRDRPKSYWGGSLKDSAIGVPVNMKSLLNEIVTKEVFSLIVGDAVKKENVISLTQMQADQKLFRRITDRTGAILGYQVDKFGVSVDPVYLNELLKYSLLPNEQLGVY